MQKNLFTSLFILLGLFGFIFGCSSIKQLGFSGTDVEVSMGREDGTDSGQPTNKYVYGTLLRFRFDVKEEKKKDLCEEVDEDGNRKIYSKPRKLTPPKSINSTNNEAKK